MPAFAPNGNVTQRAAVPSGRLHPNGIHIPAQWPPASVVLTLAPGGTGVIDRAPITPPYLQNPPASIVIRTAAGVGGRQLFVDDWLIAKTNATRVWYEPTPHPGNPVLADPQPWEALDVDTYAGLTFSGTVSYDASAGLYKCLYYGGPNNTCYAESEDGVVWTKPNLGLFGATNIVVDWSAQYHGHDSDTVWLDLNDPDPAKRWKMATTALNEGDSFWHQKLRYSADGKVWGAPVANAGQILDRTTFFWDPFLQEWVWSIRDFQNTTPLTRYRRQWRQKQFASGTWPALNNPENSPAKPLMWDRIDSLETVRHDLTDRMRDIDNGGTPTVVDIPSLYNVDGGAYESLIVLARSQLDGNAPGYLGRPKFNWVKLAFTRDGFYSTHGYNRGPFVRMGTTPQSWNYGNVQSVSPVVIVDQDQLRFYVSGRAGVPGVSRESGMCTMGMYTLRRDGFCAMEAPPGAGEKYLHTPRVRWYSGTKLYVNFQPSGPSPQMRAEIVHEPTGVAYPGFSRADSGVITADTTWSQVTFPGSLSTLVGEPASIRFYWQDGKFWSCGVTDNGGNAGGYFHQGRT